MSSECDIVKGYTSDGHVLGMLDRDQRTAKLPCSDRALAPADLMCRPLYAYCSATQCSKDRRRKDSTQSRTFRTAWCYLCSKTRLSSEFSRSSSRRRIYVRKFLLRLKQALIVSVYLLGFISVPCSLTAPIVGINFNNDMAEQTRMYSTPKWVNPCNIRQDFKTTSTIQTVANVDLVTQIVYQARTASNNAQQFRDEFAQKLFNTEFEQLHQSWLHVNFNWLPTKENIPKSLGSRLPDEHLESLELDEILLDSYENLQRIAVGLEQVVWDQEDERGPFVEKFTQMEYMLRVLLCEIQTAIYERGLEMRPDITRSIMGLDERNIESDATSKKLRALIVYRDYMNALEYIIEAFTHLKSRV